MTKLELPKLFWEGTRGPGDPEVQVALLTARIDALQGSHFAGHPKDKHGRHGLTKLLCQRRRILSYVKRRDVKRHQQLSEALGAKEDASRSDIRFDDVSVVGSYIRALRANVGDPEEVGGPSVDVSLDGE